MVDIVCVVKFQYNLLNSAQYIYCQRRLNAIFRNYRNKTERQPVLKTLIV